MKIHVFSYCWKRCFNERGFWNDRWQHTCMVCLLPPSVPNSPIDNKSQYKTSRPEFHNNYVIQIKLFKTKSHTTIMYLNLNHYNYLEGASLNPFIYSFSKWRVTIVFWTMDQLVDKRKVLKGNFYHSYYFCCVLCFLIKDKRSRLLRVYMMTQKVWMTFLNDHHCHWMT